MKMTNIARIAGDETRKTRDNGRTVHRNGTAKPSLAMVVHDRRKIEREADATPERNDPRLEDVALLPQGLAITVTSVLTTNVGKRRRITILLLATTVSEGARAV